jgi:NADPH-dependent F420 reductase
MKLAFIGGTGPAGIGLAARLSRSGHECAIGSRSVERAEEAAAKVRALVPDARVYGGTNDGILADADVVLLTVRDDAQRESVRALSAGLADKIVVSMANPLRVERGGAVYLPQPEGSLAEEVQRDAPRARVVSAFHEIRVSKFSKLDLAIDADTIVCADDEEAKKIVMQLASEAGVDPVDGGELMCARYVEAFVAVLISINFRYKTSTSYRITGLPGR